MSLDGFYEAFRTPIPAPRFCLSRRVRYVAFDREPPTGSHPNATTPKRGESIEARYGIVYTRRASPDSMVSELVDIPDHAGEDIPTPLRIAPDRYVLEEGAIADFDRYLDSTDINSAYVLGGERAVAAVGDDLEPGLDRAGIDARYGTVDGECCPSAVFDHRERIERLAPDRVIAVGGGKALDTAKLAAEGHCRVVALPTNAATCAAWTALSIVYESDGTYRTGVPLSHCPELVVADLGVLADAPARLFANGVMDASAKYFETRLIADAERPTNGWGVGLAETTYHGDLRASAKPAYEDVRAGEVTPAVEDAIETVLAAPGLVAGLLSDRSYLGLPHVFCYALLNHGAVSSRSYHGERVAYGVVVLQTLLGEDAEADPSELRAWYEELGADLTLRGLGADGDDDTIDAIAGDVESKLDDAALTVPASRAEIARAIRRVERSDVGTE
jgi:glycerol dehydrogenase-like iron-containing ADH family enzyme